MAQRHQEVYGPSKAAYDCAVFKPDHHVIQFRLPTLFAIMTAIAVFAALIRTHPVWALWCSTLIVLIYVFARDIWQGHTGPSRLIIAGTTSAFLSMMTFVALTMAAHTAYTAATNTWPDPDKVYIDIPTALLMITFTFGGTAALVGALVGGIASTVLYLLRQHESQTSK